MTVANFLAFAALLLSSIAVVFTIAARSDAKRSADAAVRVADLHEAERADDVEQAERDAVDWHVERLNGAMCQVVNRGTETAYDVLVKGQRVYDPANRNPPGTVREESVHRNEGITFITRAAMGMSPDGTISWQRAGNDRRYEQKLYLG